MGEKQFTEIETGKKKSKFNRCGGVRAVCCMLVPYRLALEPTGCGCNGYQKTLSMINVYFHTTTHVSTYTVTIEETSCVAPIEYDI